MIPGKWVILWLSHTDGIWGGTC